MDNPTNAILIVIITVIVLLALKGGVKRLRGGCCGSSQAQKRIKPQVRDKSKYPYKYVIPVSMECKNCKLRVENAFNSREGYYASASLRDGTVTVLSMTERTPEELRTIAGD